MRVAFCFTALALVGCIDFDAKLDAGAPPVTDGSVSQPDASVMEPDAAVLAPDASVADTCPGFTFEGFCWVNPTPLGDDLHAVLYRPETDEVWAGGKAGTALHGRWNGAAGRYDWHDAKLGGVLQLQRGSSGEVQGFLALIDGGLLVYGESLPMLRWNGEGWDAGLTPSVTRNAVLYGLAQLPTGEVLGVGQFDNHEYRVTSDDGVSATAAGGTGSVAGSVIVHDGAFVTMFRDSAKVARITGGGLDASVEVADNEFEALRLWEGSDGKVWFAGHGCQLGRITPPSGVEVNNGGACPTNIGSARLASGLWNAQRNRTVITGSNGVLFEATEAALLGATPQPTQFDPVVPTTMPSILAAAVLPDGGGLAVGTAGLLARRTPVEGWQAEPQVRTRLRAVVVADGGVVIVGGDRVIVTASATGGAPVQWWGARTVAMANSDELLAGWSDGTQWVSVGVNTSANTGGVWINGETLPRQVRGGSLNGVAGPSSDRLLAVGDDGVTAFSGADGGWAEGWLDAGTMSSVAWTPEGYVIGANGAVLRLQVDGGLESLARPTFPVNALAVVDGVVFVAGDNLGLGRFTLGASDYAEPIAFSEVRAGDLTAVVALSANEAWAAGGGGLLFHFVGGSWVPVESGTRRDFFGAAVSRDAAGHAWLWLVGDSGTIIRRRLQ